MRENLKIKVVLFDNDGAAINSSKWAVARHKRIARKNGLPVPKQNLIKSIWGMRWEQDVVPCLWPKQAKKFKEIYLKNYFRGKYPLFLGLIPALKKMKRRGILLGIVTSRDGESFVKRLKQSKIDSEWFFFIQTIEDSPYYKPDPQVFLPVWYKLRRLGIKKSEVLYLGDTVYDMIAAEAFGFTFVAICSGPVTRRDFRATGMPDQLILDNPAKITTIIDL